MKDGDEIFGDEIFRAQDRSSLLRFASRVPNVLGVLGRELPTQDSPACNIGQPTTLALPACPMTP